MRHVNEDNNDELFRKAAEDFFLKTDNPDWENFNNKMMAGTGQEPHDPIPKRKFLFPLPLLRLLSNFSWHKKLLSYFNHPGKSKKKFEPVFYAIKKGMHRSTSKYLLLLHLSRCHLVNQKQKQA